MEAGGGIVGEYETLHASTDADLLAMQVGDFYEFFKNDAETVNEALGLKLATKSSDGNKYPMAGVPVRELEGYIRQLVSLGYRVAIADQYETANGHQRTIERVVTPGTTLTKGSTATGYLAAVVRTGDTLALALLDAAAGRCYADLPHDIQTTEDIVEILSALDLAEVLCGPELNPAMLEDRIEATITEPPAAYFDQQQTTDIVEDEFGSEIADTLSLSSATVRAIGALLHYLEDTDSAIRHSITRVERYRSASTVTLDGTTQQNLELLETFSGEDAGSVLDTLDHTVTAAGHRLLTEWLTRPTSAEGTLTERLDIIEHLCEASIVRDTLQDRLGTAYDIERIATRCVHGSATPRDLGNIRQTLEIIPDLQAAIESNDSLADSPVSTVLSPARSSSIESIFGKLEDALVASPPDGATHGEIFARGWDSELDEIIEEHETLRDWFDSLAEREARRYGFDRVSVGETKVDGYYLQVPEGETDRVPDEYSKIKTVAAGTRYRTEELEEKERRLLRLQEQRYDREYEAFLTLREECADELTALREAANALAELDVYLSLATHGARANWTRPTFREDGVIEIDQGRHPVVEQTTRFVPNDCRLDTEQKQVLVTGPNMSGKSTYLRQVALITLLAQIGSFVPADRAAITPVDGIFTRVGASDDLAGGRSTFMVEMQEFARILHQATSDSLVILDEVGRGTATYDGISIAWAGTEYLHSEIDAKTLFATHYHELTALAEHLAGVSNLHVAAEEHDDDVIFTRLIKPGPTDRSYGIHVAEMAGVPDSVVTRANEVLTKLREEKAVEARGRPRNGTQVVFNLDSGEFHHDEEDSTAGTIAEEIEALELETTPPIELVSIIRNWQQRLED